MPGPLVKFDPKLYLESSMCSGSSFPPLSEVTLCTLGSTALPNTHAWSLHVLRTAATAAALAMAQEAVAAARSHGGLSGTLKFTGYGLLMIHG